MWNWIRMYGSAGSDSQYYSMASNGDGQIVVPGSISGQNYVHMCTYVVSILCNYLLVQWRWLS